MLSMLHASWLDTILVLVVLSGALTGWRSGLVANGLRLLGLVAALLAVVLAAWIAAAAGHSLPWPSWVMGIVAGLALLLALDLAISRLGASAFRWLSTRPRWRQADAVLGVVPGLASGFVLAVGLVWGYTTLVGPVPASSPVAQAFLHGADRPLRATDRLFARALPHVRVGPDGWTVDPPGTPAKGSAREGLWPFMGAAEAHAPVWHTRRGKATFDAASTGDLERRMAGLINQAREANGRKPLVWDDRLAAIAREHSHDELRRNYFAHPDPEGHQVSDRADAAHIAWHHIGENLSFAPNLAESHDGLMHSPGHRANILNTGFTRVGVGIVKVPGGSGYAPEIGGSRPHVGSLGGYLIVTEVFDRP